MAEKSIPQRMTTTEAAEYLGIKPGTLHTWRCIGRHKIPYIKVGASVRYDRTALDEYMKNNTLVETK